MQFFLNILLTITHIYLNIFLYIYFRFKYPFQGHLCSFFCQVSTFFFLIFLVLYIFKIQILRYMYILKNNLHFGFFFLIFVISFIFWEKMNVQKSHEDSRESSYMFQFLLVIISHYCSAFVKIKLVIVKLQTLFRFYQFFFFVLFLFQAPIQDTILHLVIHLQFPQFYDSSSIFPNFSYLNSIESAGQVFSRISVKLGLFDVFIIIIIILCFFFFLERIPQW